MNATTKKMVISALMLGLSGGVYVQTAGGGAATTGSVNGTGMNRNSMGGSNDGSTGAGAPVRSGMGNGTNQGPDNGSQNTHMKSNGMSSGHGKSNQKRC